MSLKFKKTMDLELVNDVPVGANVLIETDYATKRLPVTAINNGYSKEECDEKFMASDAKTSWNDLQDKPFYEEVTIVTEPLNITWDGNTNGLVSVGGGMAYKVSDVVLTDEQLKTCTVMIHDDGETYPLVENWDESVENGDVVLAEEYSMVDSIVVVRKAPTTFNGILLPEVGVYVSAAPFYYTITTEPIEQTKTVVHKLDKKYLPDNIGGGKVLKIIRSDFGNYLSEVSPMLTGYTYEANMTLEEARAAFRACELDGVVFYNGNARIDMYYSAEALSNSGIVYFGFACVFMGETIELFWTEEYGITDYNPYPGGNPE